MRDPIQPLIRSAGQNFFSLRLWCSASRGCNMALLWFPRVTFEKNSMISSDSNQRPSGLYHFFYLVYETIGTAATPGLLCQPRVIMKMIVEK
jgi:hypothetical protein